MTCHAQEPGHPEEIERRQPPLLRLSRRRFLVGILGTVSTLAGVIGYRTLTGTRSEGGSRGGATRGFEGLPVRSVDDAPNVPLERWEVIVDGLVERPVTVDHATWAGLPHVAQTADFHCVEGWSVNGLRWRGVRPAAVLALARPLPRATHAVFHAFDGTYTDSLPLDALEGERALLADTLEGRRLQPANGGPIRLLVPDQMAYKSVKFVRRIELTDGPRVGFWEQRGYPMDAPAPTAHT